MGQKEYQAAIDAAVAKQMGDLDLGDDDTPVASNVTENEGDGGSIEEEEDGEEEVYTKDQVSLIVKTRVDKMKARLDKMDPVKKTMDKLCELTGLDFNQLSAKLNDMSLSEQSRILGVPVETLQQQQAKKGDPEKEKLMLKLEAIELKSDPKYKDLDLFMDAIEDLREEHPSLTLAQAYTLVKGDTGLAAAKAEGEQLAMAKIVNGHKKSVVKPGVAGAPAPKITKDVENAAKAVGMDAATYGSFQNIDNIDAYRAYKKAQKR